MKAFSFLSFLMCLITLILLGCSQQKTDSLSTVTAIQNTIEFTCGPQTCVTKSEYCYKVFAAAVQPGTDGISHTCEKLPHGDCQLIERTGKCLGTPESGITVELYLP